ATCKRNDTPPSKYDQRPLHPNLDSDLDRSGTPAPESLEASLPGRGDPVKPEITRCPQHSVGRSARVDRAPAVEDGSRAFASSVVAQRGYDPRGNRDRSDSTLFTYRRVSGSGPFRCTEPSPW